MKYFIHGLFLIQLLYSTALFDSSLFKKTLFDYTLFPRLRTPDSYDLINCYVRVFFVLFKSEYVVCAGFHLSVKNVRTPTVNIHNFAKMVFHYKRLHFLHLSVFYVPPDESE